VPVVVLAAGATLAAAQRPADDNAFPHTKSYGRATIQFRDEKVHMVAGVRLLAAQPRRAVDPAAGRCGR
jgi:hypothetical protein